MVDFEPFERKLKNFDPKTTFACHKDLLIIVSIILIVHSDVPFKIGFEQLNFTIKSSLWIFFYYCRFLLQYA